jgi:dTMP kinase
MAETLLLYAARSDHLDRLIRPALERDAIVLCDRYLDSTRAYQGAAGGVDPHFIDALERSVVGSARPDLTLILDLDPAEGLRRAERRAQGGTRFEDMDLAFHQRLRSAFLAIAEREADRCVVIDASQSSEAVSAAIWAVVSGRMFQGADP